MVLSVPTFFRRSRRYGSLHADPAIARRTQFFAAASLVTGTLALIGPSRFLRDLSETLEVANLLRAQEIRSRRLYHDDSIDDSIEKNTVDFIHYEQTLVQAALDALRSRHPQLYWREVNIANFLLNALNRAGARYLLRSAFAQAVRAAIAELGADIDFARQNHREMLGLQLARASARPRCDHLALL
jgi:hypothetical protein